MAGHPTLFLLCATLADEFLLTRSKNSLGKFPEHKVITRSWKAAVESCLHRGEKDKRRKDRKGAKAASHERSQKNNRALPSRAHCPSEALTGLGPLQPLPHL